MTWKDDYLEVGVLWDVTTKNYPQTRIESPMTDNSLQLQITDLLAIVEKAGVLSHAAQSIPALAQRVAEAATNPEKFAKRLAKLQTHIADGKQTFDELLDLVTGLTKAAVPADPSEA